MLLTDDMVGDAAPFIDTVDTVGVETVVISVCEVTDLETALASCVAGGNDGSRKTASAELDDEEFDDFDEEDFDDDFDDDFEDEEDDFDYGAQELEGDEDEEPDGDA